MARIWGEIFSSVPRRVAPRRRWGLRARQSVGIPGEFPISDHGLHQQRHRQTRDTELLQARNVQVVGGLAEYDLINRPREVGLRFTIMGSKK